MFLLVGHQVYLLGGMLQQMSDNAEAYACRSAGDDKDLIFGDVSVILILIA